jgi:hypothetical protein
MKNKVCTEEEKQVAKDWSSNWQEFNRLLNKVTRPGQLPPTEKDEIAYQTIRRWFMDNERIFIRIWNDFCEHRLQDCTDDISDIDLQALDEDNFVTFLKNPFGFYYRSGTFYTWAHHMGLQYSTIAWEPDEQKMQKIRPILGFLSKVLAKDMMDWVEG